MRKCLFCGFKYDVITWKCPLCGMKPEIVGGFTSFSPEVSNLNNNYEPDAYNVLAEAEDKNFWFRSRNKLIMWVIGKYFSNIQNVIEIGCGTGYVLSEIERSFPFLSVTGGDIFVKGIDYASRRIKKAELLQMDCRSMPFEEEFDLVGAFDVIEHIEEEREVLTQVYNAIKPGGGLIMTVPHHKFLWSRSDEYSCHFRRYTAVELRRIVEGAGFKIVRLTSFIAVLLPFMVASRLINNKIDYSPLKELKISPVLNFIFEHLLNIERSMIKFGINFPFGGSLLTIARKVPGGK